jgi:hypothetical protein
MPLASLRYGFRQSFRAPARAAYRWCTDFRASDAALFEGKHRRSVRRIAEDTVILTDSTYPDGRLQRIRRLVRLLPAQLAWTNTHLDGPYRHSQYWYRIVPDGSHRSHLEFTGLRLVRVPRTLPLTTVARMTDLERTGDARAWREGLAPALERDLA